MSPMHAACFNAALERAGGFDPSALDALLTEQTQPEAPEEFPEVGEDVPTEMIMPVLRQATIDRKCQGRFTTFKEHFVAARAPLDGTVLLGEFVRREPDA